MSEKSNMSSDVAKIVLVPHERSHPFARRECVVREPLKVGRSVDKKRISANNLIFDCRVLSRNHAVIWFENGKVRGRGGEGGGRGREGGCHSCTQVVVHDEKLRNIFREP